MAEPRSASDSQPASQASQAPNDPTVPEEATEEPAIRGDDEEDERAARREAQQERTPHTIWPDADYPYRQGGEMSPAPAKRHR
jgi:hypothetical protein